MRRILIALAALVALGCGDDNERAEPDGGGPPVGCADHNPLRNLYFGDLHVHTAYSFDAYVFEVRATPIDAYRFARGEPLRLPPLGEDGLGTQTLRLRRPLDFAAVTDHSEFLGETEVCTVPGADGYASPACVTFRAGGNAGQALIGIQLAVDDPERSAEVCGADLQACRARAGEVWSRTLAAAAAAEDQSAACRFTTFAAYEYTANTGASTQHRNVIFRNQHVPFPTSYMEQPTPQGLWRELKATCLDAGSGCDVLAIPHNSNESNGKMFLVEYPGATNAAEERAQAAFRAGMEPLVEIYQHKGDSECMNGLSGVVGVPDELCEFEKRPRPQFQDCGDGTGQGGVAGGGCFSWRDFVRGALLAGLQEAERIGVNPYPLGFVGATDTHNGTPGAVEEETFIGHRGTEDASVEARLGTGSRRAGPSFSPGGLTAVWAEENSRESLFSALRRREVYATSGPRIAVRVFAGWDLDEALCAEPDMVRRGYERGVPMGGTLAAPPGDTASPTFLIAALRDPGTADHPGMPLQRLQIVKGWIEGGEARQKVFDVAGDPENGASVDPETCLVEGTGFDSLCTVWRDPEFDPEQHAFYYARAVENPSCRWNAYQCSAIPPADRPPSCADPEIPRTVQERAWTSPIWYEPRV